MSRCFPFPPPGYEKKAKPDNADLLQEEKHREKKHKKEKDKEKREGKEKREKDRSESKHKEKRDKKEKHKDKKDKHRDRKKDKDKEKGKDKDKHKENSSVSEDKKVSGLPESYNGEKLHQKEDRSKDRSSTSYENKPAVHFQGHNGSKPMQNSVLVEMEASKFVQEFGRRIRDDEKGTGSQLVGRSTGTDRKRDEHTDRFKAGNAGMLVEGLEKNKEKRVDIRKMEGQGLGNETKFSGNARVQNSAGMQHNVEALPKQMEKNIERKFQGKEKPKDREDDKQGDKLKDKGREKKIHGKDKDGEKKKEEKVKKKSEHENAEQDKPKDINKNILVGFDNNKVLHLLKDGDRNATAAAVERNLNKRKEYATNGFLHDNDVRPTKMSRHASISFPPPEPAVGRPHSLTENGRKLEPFQSPSPFNSDRSVAANNLKMDKGQKLNGVFGAPPLSISTKEPLPATSHADQVAEASKKPPHPDTKYLSQVLSVPNMKVWSDFDDQEWLFSSKDPPLKKPVMSHTSVGGEPLVWAEATQIESADICALPYVIPY